VVHALGHRALAHLRQVQPGAEVLALAAEHHGLRCPRAGSPTRCAAARAARR
jgi:hypothetical protein